MQSCISVKQRLLLKPGKAGTVTIATNMAGRGTDIKLTPEVRKPEVWQLSVLNDMNQGVLTVS